jgi:hypothetical protein
LWCNCWYSLLLHCYFCACFLLFSSWLFTLFKTLLKKRSFFLNGKFYFYFFYFLF